VAVASDVQKIVIDTVFNYNGHFLHMLGLLSPPLVMFSNRAFGCKCQSVKSIAALHGNLIYSFNVMLK